MRDLFETLAIDLADLEGFASDFAVDTGALPRWTLWRQDDNGIRAGAFSPRSQPRPPRRCVFAQASARGRRQSQIMWRWIVGLSLLFGLVGCAGDDGVSASSGTTSSTSTASTSTSSTSTTADRSVLLHRGPLEEGDLGIVESASHEGARKGAMTLGAIGAGLGAVSGGLLGVGFLAGLALGGGLLAIYGGIFGGIAGADEPERQVRALERQLENGAVLIAVKTDDPGLIEMCQGVLDRNGGHPFVT